jgi:peptidyl-prolyl cis-trans isomerase B (cyclophilin B)
VPARTPRNRDRESLRRSRLYTARQSVHNRQGARRRRDNVIASIVFVIAVTAAAFAQVGFFTVGPGKPVAAPKPSASATPTPSPTATATAPPPSAAENRTWTGTMTLNSTRLGITLDGKKAPQAVASFVTLAKKGFYTGLTCHRLTTGDTHILQCGDPKGDGSGGPGYSFGPIENAPKDGVYPAGTIAMARQSGNASSQGSQFFIVTATSSFPDDAAGGYTVFGRVTSGLPALRTAITSKGVAGGGSDDVPKVATKITRVTVE